MQACEMEGFDGTEMEEGIPKVYNQDLEEAMWKLYEDQMAGKLYTINDLVSTRTDTKWADFPPNKKCHYYPLGKDFPFFIEVTAQQLNYVGVGFGMAHLGWTWNKVPLAVNAHNLISPFFAGKMGHLATLGEAGFAQGSHAAYNRVVTANSSRWRTFIPRGKLATYHPPLRKGK
jgi:hypothetical protein